MSNDRRWHRFHPCHCMVLCVRKTSARHSWYRTQRDGRGALHRIVPKAKHKSSPLWMRASYISGQAERIVIGWMLLRSDCRASNTCIYALARVVDYRNFFHFIAERIVPFPTLGQFVGGVRARAIVCVAKGKKCLPWQGYKQQKSFVEYKLSGSVAVRRRLS